MNKMFENCKKVINAKEVFKNINEANKCKA